MNKDFLELTQDEMLSINGGMEKWKRVTYATGGGILLVQSVPIGIIATPLMGVRAAKLGLKFIRKARYGK